MYFFLVCTTQTLVPQPGIEPVPRALGGGSLNHRAARKVPEVYSLNQYISYLIK